MYDNVNHHYIVSSRTKVRTMASRRDLGHHIAAQAAAVAGEGAELRRLATRVEQVWASPDGDRLRLDVARRASALEEAAADLVSFGRRIEAEAVAAVQEAAAEKAAAGAEAEPVSAGSGAGGGTGRGGVAP
jgi:hypothetical protein